MTVWAPNGVKIWTQDKQKMILGGWCISSISTYKIALQFSSNKFSIYTPAIKLTRGIMYSANTL